MRSQHLESSHMDFKQLIGQAEQEELLTAQERKEQEREQEAGQLETAEANRRKANKEAAAELRDIWLAVLKGLLSRRPPHSIMILDALRLDKLPSRMPEGRGWRRSHHNARWNKAADGIAIPAWDMLATFNIGGWGGETYRVAPYEMYFGSNGVVYCDPTVPESNETHAVWRASFSSAEEVPGVWRPEVTGTHADTFDGRREVAVGFARLVARHSLEIDSLG